MTVPILLILTALCVLLSGFFSGAETGAYRVNRIRLRLRSDQGDADAMRLSKLLDDGPGILSVTLLGTNIANYLATVSVALLIRHAATQFSDHQVEVYTTLILMPVIFVFGEVTPKNWFRQQADTLMAGCSGALLVFDTLFRMSGAVAVLKWLSSGLLRLWRVDADLGETMHPRRQMAVLLREGVAEGIMTDQQSQLVDGVLRLASVHINSVMIPYAKVCTVNHGARRHDILQTIRQHAYSRYPVIGQGKREVLGILDVYHYLSDPDADAIAAHVSQPMRISPRASVSATLYRMRQARQTFGIVVDPNDHCIGVVTVKDLVEEIVGDLSAGRRREHLDAEATSPRTETVMQL